MEAYAVQRRRPTEVRAEVEQLWRRNLPLEQSASAKFSWLYERAPLPPESIFVLGVVPAPAAVGEPDFIPVGTAGVGLRELAVAGRVLRAGLLADLAVDRAHRTVAPALRLVREVKAWVLDELDLAYGFPNQHARGVFRRAGYQPLGPIQRYVRVLRHRGYLERMQPADFTRLPERLRAPAQAALARGPGARWLAAATLDGLQLARDLPDVVSGYLALDVSSASRPPHDVDALWGRCGDAYAVAAVRSTRLLSWRYPEAPERRWFAARRGAALAAYAVVDQVDDAAHIRDLFGERAAVVTLLHRLIFDAYRRGAASVSMRYLGDAWLHQALRAARFEARDADRVVFWGASSRLAAAQREALADPSRWFLTDLDEDV
ncbi:MAG: hypothetical protein R3B48_13190 [Kofleriaceae bacterium]